MIVLFALAFILELVAFGAFAGLAFVFEMNTALQIILCTLVLSTLVTFWGVFMSPRAPKKLQPRLYATAKSVIYLLAAAALFTLTSPVLDLAFIATWLLDEIFLYLLSAHRKQTAVS